MEKQTQHHPPVYPLLPPAPVEELDIDMVRRQAAQIYRETYAVSDEELDEKFRREGCTSTAFSYVKYVQEEIPSCQANIQFALYAFGSDDFHNLANYVLFEEFS